MIQIAVIGFKTINGFCNWAKYEKELEQKDKDVRNVWIDRKNNIVYIGIFEENDLIGRRFHDFIERESLRLGIKSRIIKGKPYNNFGKITQSYESLADYITMVSFCPFGYTDLVPCHKQGCKECIKEWLKKECD